MPCEVEGFTLESLLEGCSYKPRNTQDCQKPPEARREMEQILSQSPQKKTNPAFISHLGLPEL